MATGASKSAKIQAAADQRAAAARAESARLNPPWPWRVIPLPKALLDPRNNAELRSRGG